VKIFICALGDRDDWKELAIAPGDGKGSTFLPEVTKSFNPEGTQPTLIRRFDTVWLDIGPCNTLVVDVQGMELQVLRGFGEKLAHFDFLNIECSRVPLYEGKPLRRKLWITLLGTASIRTRQSRVTMMSS